MRAPRTLLCPAMGSRASLAGAAARGNAVVGAVVQDGVPTLSRRALLFEAAPLAAVMSQVVQVPSNTAVARTAEAIFRKDPMPALSVAAYRGNVLAFAHAYGVVDLELAVAASTSHRFRVGSGAKPVTATLAAIMADEGIVDLDAGIGRYMPALPHAHHATTLRQLLTHRGGVRHYSARDSDRTAVGGAIDSRTYFSNADVLAIFIDDPLVARPGSRMMYSTFGYTLASIVLETAAATPFLDLIQQKIAAPLGLASLAADAPRRVIPGRVRGYGKASAVREVPPVDGVWANAPTNNPAYKWAGGGLLMTASDFARFGAAHLAPGVLSRRALDTLFTVYVPDGSPPLGLGWRINRDSRGRLRWHHAGGQEGARSSLVVYPEQQLSIAFASNATGTPADVLSPSERLADAL